MRKRFRGLRIAALVAAVAIGVSGCAISSTGSNAGSSEGTTTLTFWEYYQGTQLTWLKSQVKVFEKANPNVKINLVQVVGSQQDQKLLASVATGTTPDLFINNIVVDYPTLVAGGVTKDLTSYWNAYADKSEFPDSAVWKTKGKVYNLMSYTNLLGLFYNKDILDKNGITKPPTTLDELQADLAKVKAGGDQGIALSGAPTVEGAWLFAPQLLGLGVSYCNFTGSKVTAAFDRVGDWAKDGYTPQATATWDQNASWQQFMTGKYAFGLNGNWQLGNVKSASFAYGTTQFPKPDGGKSVVYPGGEGFGIGAKSKHPELAWKFLQQAVLSKQGGESVFSAAGSIPVRSDLSDIPAIKKDAYVQPFVAAAQTSGQWPNNTNTANAQTALGKAVSGVISGQTTAAQGAQTAESDIKAALAKGGGTCQ
jgi:multiple sugar transport system substrate-binding protein